MELHKAIVLTTSISRAAGGVFDAVRRLSQELSRETAVEVHGIRDDCTDRDMIHWHPLSPLACEGVGPLRYAPHMTARVAGSATQGTILHLHGLWTWPSYVTLRVSSRHGIPRMISPHGMLDPWALKNSCWKKWIVRKWFEDRNLSGAHCLHALCESEYESIRALGLTNPVAIIPNGIDIPEEREPMQSSPLPNSWEGHKVLLFLSRVHPKKGLMPLIQAWARLNGDRADWKLAIAGPDENGHRPEIEALIDKFGLCDSVAFVGPQYGLEKRAWLQYADAYVLPSFSEGFPMAVLEAMAYKLPVLMTPQCNFPEAFATGAAICAEPTPGQLAEGLRKLFKMSEGKRRETGEQGYRLVKANYTWPVIAGQMISVYRWLLGRGILPECVRVR